MSKSNITAVIIAKNESAMIANCIETLRWCDEIVVLNNNSDDDTGQIARNLSCRVIDTNLTKFDALRNEALDYVKTDWVFYIDADERVLPKLAQEIMVQVETMQGTAISMQRQNIMYGQEMKHGGWGLEWVTRVFLKQALHKWTGIIHESPQFTGKVVKVFTPLVHLTHRSAIDGLQKTIEWTPLEAKLLFAAKINNVTLFTLFRKGMMEFLRRYLFQAGYKDGLAGGVEALTQAINRVLVYIQVYELQQQPPIPQKYQKYESEIAQEWKKAS